MASVQEFSDALAKVDAETTRIGLLVQKLADDLASGGLTAEQEAAALDQLRGAGTRLEGIAHSVQNPIPPDVPV